MDKESVGDSEQFLSAIGVVTAESARLEAETRAFIGGLLYGDQLAGIELFIDITFDLTLKLFARIFLYKITDIERRDEFKETYDAILKVNLKRNEIIHSYWFIGAEEPPQRLSRGTPEKGKHKSGKKIFPVILRDVSLDEIREVARDIQAARISLDALKENLIKNHQLKKNPPRRA